MLTKNNDNMNVAIKNKKEIKNNKNNRKEI